MPRSRIQRRRRRLRARETKMKETVVALVRRRPMPEVQEVRPVRPPARHAIPEAVVTGDGDWTPGAPYRRRS